MRSNSAEKISLANTILLLSVPALLEICEKSWECKFFANAMSGINILSYGIQS